MKLEITIRKSKERKSKETYIGITFCLLILFLVSGCHYKKLGCIICYKHKRTDTTYYESGQIKTIKRFKCISQRATDVPTKCKEKVKTFNKEGVLVQTIKETSISSVWNFENRESKKKEKIFYPKTDSLKREVRIFKNGKQIIKKIK